MKPIHKTALASVKLTSEGSAILSLQSPDAPTCFFFENTDQLADAIREKNIRAKRWVVSVPDTCCITKYIELPAIDISQAYRMLEFEIPSFLPLPAKEIVYGCLPVRKNEGLLKVLVYILKTKTIEEALEKCKSIGIKPSKIMVDSIAVKSWFCCNRISDANQINILYENDRFFISATKEGELQKHEEFPLQNSNLENQNESIKNWIDDYFIELPDDKQVTIRVATDKPIQTKAKIWLNGHFKSVEFLELPELKSFDQDIACPQKNFLFESVIAQGLIKASQDPDFKFLNLLGIKALKNAQLKQLVSNIAITIGAGIFAVFCLWLNFMIMNWNVQSACQKIEKEIAPIRHISTDVESKRQKVKAIQSQLSNRDQISAIFSQLYKYSPPEISISQMGYSSQIDSGSVSIKGQADTLSGAFEYSDAMKESKLLNNIQIINAQQIPKPGGSIIEFKAECVIESDSTVWK